MSTETMSITERREALRIQQEQLAREETELREKEQSQLAAKHEEERQTRIRVMNLQLDGFRNAILAQLKLMAPTVDFKVVDNVAAADNFRVYLEFNQKTERYGGYRSKDVPNSFYIIVGNYGDKTKYPPKKDNTHSYDKIAANILGRYNDDLQKKKAEALRVANINVNSNAASNLRTDFKLNDYGNITVKPSTYQEGYVLVKQPELVQLTPEQARELLELYAKFGKVNR